MERTAREVLAGTFALIVLGGPGRTWAAEAAIDLFSSASATTQYVVDTNVKADVVGSVEAIDSGLSGVIGGVRDLTVTATALDFPMFDAVVSGVSAPPLHVLVYTTSSGADGSITLTYDRGGSGLNAFLAFATGIRVPIVGADLTCVNPGLDVTVTLTDTFMQTAASTLTVLLPVTPGMPLNLDFPFTAFTGVDPSSLLRIQIAVDPQLSAFGGCDLELAGVQTFGTPIHETICDDGIDNNNNGFTDCADVDCETFPGCPHPAPTLSTTGLGIALLVLSALGALALRRLRRR
jgi:hypothetical protein